MVILIRISLNSERATQAQFRRLDPLADATTKVLGDAACDILNWLLPKTPTML